MTHTYHLTGMTCNGCVAKVKNELLKLGGITQAEVGLSAPQATISMQQHVSLPELQTAVSKAGSYTITEAESTSNKEVETNAIAPPSYYPIFLIFGFIAGVAALAQASLGSFSFALWMQHFMAGFFLVFSFFKLLNLPAFAEGYRTYDIVAKQLPAYGFVYPFLELALGIAYLTGFSPLLTNVFALALMGISTIGVARSLWKKQVFQCACLGTIIKLPLSKVTLFEDVLMVVMSGAMLLML